MATKGGIGMEGGRLAQIAVGVDIGTTSVKAVAVDADGMLLARARVPHAIHHPSADVFQHDANEAWRQGPKEAMRQLETTLRDQGIPSYDAIAICSMVPSFTAVDDDGVPMTPGLLYGDYRGRVAGTAGDPMNSGEWRAMLEWTIAQAPGARGYWPAPAVAGVALGGQPVVDMGVGFGLSPLWDMEWKSDALRAVGATPEQMPLVALTDREPVGHIGGAVQAASMADAWAEATVAAAGEPGDCLVICGTTLIVWAVVPEHREVPGLWLIPHPRHGRLVLGGASNAGGMFVNWARRSLAVGPEPLDPANVPVWVPYLRGERTPVHDHARRASIHHLDISHGGGDLLRAVYETSGFAVRRMLDLAGGETKRIVASGGGVHDRAWMQALADTTGLPVDLAAVPEGAAYGAAWYARMAAGWETTPDDATRWARDGDRVEPDPRWAAACGARYEEWLTLAG